MLRMEIHVIKVLANTEFVSQTHSKEEDVIQMKTVDQAYGVILCIKNVSLLPIQEKTVTNNHQLLKNQLNVDTGHFALTQNASCNTHL